MPLLATLFAVLAPAQAGVVPDARCGGPAPDLRHGFCYDDRHGGVFWLGTRAGYDGIELYCIDYAFATRWRVAHHRTTVTDGLITSLGGRVGRPTVAALNYLVTRYPADSVGDTSAAAIGLIIRQVMGDVRGTAGPGIPGGLRVSGRVRDVDFIDDAVIARARRLWDEARIHRGPWTLDLSLDPGPDGVVTVGEKVALTVTGRNGSGGPQDLTVVLRSAMVTGGRSFRLGADGSVRVVLTAPTVPTKATVTARAARTPGPYPVVIRPDDWQISTHPGRPSAVTQRGLLGRQSPVTARASMSVVIVKATPQLITVASAQQVEPGALIHDTVALTGTNGAESSFAWSLLGPVPALADGHCPGPGAAWAGAKTLASGQVSTPRDGVYRTPDYQVRANDLGCLTYVESRPETATTRPVTTPAGIAEETVLVVRPKSVPCVRTQASRQRGLVGTALYDRVTVGCISSPDRVTVTWTAHGPIAPRWGISGKAGCDGIAPEVWEQAPVAATGSFVATRADTYATAPVPVKRPGCYNFSESIPATATSLAAASPPGLSAETALITRPRNDVVPVVPTGPRLAASALGASSSFVGDLRVAGLRIWAPVQAVGLRDGSMAIPTDVRRVGWLRTGAHPDDVVGSSVIAGHVADHGRPGALAQLSRIKRDATVVWTDQLGVPHRFRVISVQRHRRDRPLPAEVFRTDGPHVLRLITCTDPVRRPGGGRHYRANLIVTAVALS